MTQKHLAQVVLHNFRSHEHTTIDVGSLTSLIGENDCGKSNVYHALDMVLTNSPFTESALRYGTKEGWVRVTFHDGTWLERHRNGSKQKAVVFDGKKTTEYTTVKDLGPMVEEFTGFSPVVLDKQTKAESVQLIPIDAGQNFMVVGNSAEVVNRRIQRLMHGAGIETAKIQLDKETRTLKAKAEREQADRDQCAKLVEILDRTVWGDAAQSVDSVKLMITQMHALDDRLGVLDEIFELLPQYTRGQEHRRSLNTIDDQLKRLEEVSVRQEQLEDIDVKGTQEAIEQDLTTLDTLDKEIQDIDKQIAELQPKIAQLEQEAQEKAIKEAQEKAVKDALEQRAIEEAQAENAKANFDEEKYVDAPVNLVLDTIDCLHSFVNRKDEDKTIELAQEIAGDWEKLCPAS